MSELSELKAEAFDTLDQVWFVQSVTEIEQTDITLSLRLHIRPQLFVQLFFGQRSGSLYMALIEGKRRVFGIDREIGDWHIHPYENVEKHEHLADGLEPKPLFTFLARVEELLLEHDLL